MTTIKLDFELRKKVEDRICAIRDMEGLVERNAIQAHEHRLLRGIGRSLELPIERISSMRYGNGVFEYEERA